MDCALMREMMICPRHHDDDEKAVGAKPRAHQP